MGFWKWLGDYARNYNDNYERKEDASKRAKWAQEEAETRYKNSLNCCANCLWFERYDGQLNHCIKHDFCFDLDDVKYNEIEYKKTCMYFEKR